MINQTFKGKYETAIIYENLGNGVEIAKYKHEVSVVILVEFMIYQRPFEVDKRSAQ